MIMFYSVNRCIQIAYVTLIWYTQGMFLYIQKHLQQPSCRFITQFSE